MQRTKIGEHVSNLIEVELGVPQGSVLGVLLFLVYINDIGTVVKHCKISLFADDTLVYISGKNVVVITDKLNEDLNNIYELLNMNKLMLNVNKTKCMFLMRLRLIR